jgi:hypothetical protein
MENWRRYLKEARWEPSDRIRTKGAIMLELEPPPNVDELISVGQQKHAGTLESATEAATVQHGAEMEAYEAEKGQWEEENPSDEAKYANWKRQPKQPMQPQPEEFTEIEKFHVTLVPISQLKGVGDDQKQTIVDKLQSIPEPELGSDVFFATRKDGRKTLYIKVDNSDAINSVVNSALEAAGLPTQDKYMHMSIANVHGGKGGSSVGDINEDDEDDEGKVIVPAHGPQKMDLPPKPKPPIPDALRRLGGVLKDKMVPTAGMWPNLKRMKDNERALTGIFRGKLKLDQTQIDAVMGVLGELS